MNEQVVEITKKLEESLENLFESEKYKQYLHTMSKFHNYSWSNVLLIGMQRPDATYVAGYNSWMKNFGRYVKKGEKGIKIIAPSPIKKKVERDIVDSSENIASADPLLATNLSEKVRKEEVEIIIPRFHVVTVFDYSQTEGKELPSIGVDELTGNVDGYEKIISALEEIAPVPIERGSIDSGAKGYFSPSEQKIMLQDGMSEIQTVKTLIHETAHALLHDKDCAKVEGVEDKDGKSRNSKEVEAESVAYTVCDYLGIDTGDYSFGYIAGWSQGRDLKELKDSMETIRKTASKIISGIEDKCFEKNIEKAVDEIAEKSDSGPEINRKKVNLHKRPEQIALA